MSDSVEVSIPLKINAAQAVAIEEVPEIWSVRLSLLGAAIGIPGIGALLIPSAAAGSPVHFVTYCVYGVGLLSMFLASAAFHARANHERTFLKNVDYCAIALMLGGSFTPYCTLALGTTFSYSILGLIWTIALGAITLRISRPHMSKWVFVTAYLGMGWLGMLMLYPLLQVLGIGGTGLTILGGVIYTAGTLIFNRYEGDVEPPGFGPHDVWHIFILLGAFCHWLVLRLYMLP